MEQAKNNRAAGLIGTVTFHALLFLLFWLIVFKTPIPPFPEEGGSGYEVNFGTSETGSGEVQPMEDAGNNPDIDETDKIEPQVKASTSASSAQNIITDETNKDESTEVNSGKAEEKSESKSFAQTEQTTKQEERKAESRFLMKKKKGSAASANEGEAGGKGDQGSADGSRNTLYHGPGGNGGVGIGPGKGEGIGSNVGPGISFNLKDRKPSSLPIPKASFTEEGKVVVEIKVDQNGVVVSAKPGVKGSTTTNPQLMEIARKAALSASFNTNHDAPDVQKGTIIYNFFLK